VDAGWLQQRGEPVQELEGGEPEHGTAFGGAFGQAISDFAFGPDVPPCEPLKGEDEMRRPTSGGVTFERYPKL
jgi:hypothetical protein